MFRVCDTKECVMATNNQNNLEKDKKLKVTYLQISKLTAKLQ